jgi:hypothetical protein
MSHIAYKIIDEAERDIMAWATKNSVPVHRVEFVAVFEEWNNDLPVWVFYETDEDIRICEANGSSKNLETRFMEILRERNYPFDEFPEVLFVFDSHENVEKNYQGSYFSRLR